MLRNRRSVFLFTLAATLFLTSSVFADRFPTRRVSRVRATGTRPSIVVPYLTNGSSNFGVYQGVAPRIYKSPVVNELGNPGARPVYNLPFYGGKMGFGGRSNGAVTRPSLTPQPVYR